MAATHLISQSRDRAMFTTVQHSHFFQQQSVNTVNIWELRRPVAALVGEECCLVFVGCRILFMLH